MHVYKHLVSSSINVHILVLNPIVFHVVAKKYRVVQNLTKAHVNVARIKLTLSLKKTQVEGRVVTSMSSPRSSCVNMLLYRAVVLTTSLRSRMNQASKWLECSLYTSKCNIVSQLRKYKASKT